MSSTVEKGQYFDEVKFLAFYLKKSRNNSFFKKA